MFRALMEKRGLSDAKGSGRQPEPGTKFGGGVVKPPVYGGIVPSALPAFSAPKGVRVVPNLAASSLVTVPNANPEYISAIIKAITAILIFFFLHIIIFLP
jgi:hypothetical protein